MKNRDYKKRLLNIYRLLYKNFGSQHWWPGETKLEIIIGSILTQNTSWSNVEKAIANLKREGILRTRKLSDVSIKRLGLLIKPAGYYNIKSERIKNFLTFLNANFGGSINKMFREETYKLREKLLNVKGIGQETADSILLYAGAKPLFVVDSYTKRIFSRQGFIREDAEYEEVQKLFSNNLPKDVRLFNEFHALIVALGKNICRKTQPLCERCPIRRRIRWLKKKKIRL